MVSLGGTPTVGKGVFIEKKSEVTVYGAATLPDVTTVDDGKNRFVHYYNTF